MLMDLQWPECCKLKVKFLLNAVTVRVNFFDRRFELAVIILIENYAVRRTSKLKIS